MSHIQYTICRSGRYYYNRRVPISADVKQCGGNEETSQSTENAAESPAQAAANNVYTPRLSTATTFPMTGNSFVDASTQGSYWTPDDGILTYAVANGLNGEEWNNANYVSQKLGQALEQISRYTNLKFYDAGIYDKPSIAASNGATIVLSLDGEGHFFSDSAWALGHYPDSASIIYEGQSGDIYLNINSGLSQLPDAAYEAGGKGFMVLLHELGHAFGLKHPFDNTGGRPTYEEAGYSGYDDQTYTVMSYDDEFGALLNSDGTFMLGDVLALMWLYGINEKTNTGDTVHNLNLTDVRSTIWDSSGIDTIDLSNNTTNTSVRLSYLYSDVDLALEYGYIRIDINSSEHKTHWLIGEFEKVIGGRGDDTILGDENNNTLNGGIGSDGLDGYGGNDVLYGGPGVDVFRLGPKGGNDVIKDFQVGADTCIFWDGTTLNASLAALITSENGDAMYVIADGSSITLEDVTIADMGLIA